MDSRGVNLAGLHPEVLRLLAKQISRSRLIGLRPSPFASIGLRQLAPGRHLRSPAFIDEAGRSATDGAYDASYFPASSATSFGGAAKADDQLDASGDAGLIWSTAGGNRWPTQRAPASPLSAWQPDNFGRYRLAAAATPRGFWDYWGVRGCANCHGYKPGTLPPAGGHSPFPPNYSPRSGNSNGSSTPQPRRDERKQCAAQERNDRGVCTQQPTERAKAVCHQSATRRRVHCNATGEIGEPELFTARRRSGRPWP